MSEPSALNVATAIVDEWLSWHRDTRPRPTYGFPPKYFADDLIDAIAKALEVETRKSDCYFAALKQIVAEADSDDGLTAWDGGEIAGIAIAKVENMK